MSMSRRQLLKGMALTPATCLVPAALAGCATRPPGPGGGIAQDVHGVTGLSFEVGRYETCLNNARWHPMSMGSRKETEAFLGLKQRVVWNPPDLIGRYQDGVKRDFARLINADVRELAYVNSTTAGESMFVSSLGLPSSQGNIVTDALHFEGSLYLYGALKEQGMDVRLVRPDKHWRINLEDMARVIDKDTRLVAVSWVSFINGFEHDINALCELAHAHGALVYVDAVQAVGAVPVDVRASGVDAMGCASYKWLMGDFGLGFLYVNQSVIPKLQRIVLGYRQLNGFDYHAFPGDPKGPYPASWSQHDDASGFFEIGTYANVVLAGLSYSLPAILELGVEQISKHNSGLIATLQREMPRLGYAPMTPEDAGSPIATFFMPRPEVTRARLEAAKVDVSIQNDRMRVSPSMYNTAHDVEKLLEALS